MVLRILITDEKETRIRICQEWLEADEDNDIFLYVITDEKSLNHEWKKPWRS